MGLERQDHDLNLHHYGNLMSPISMGYQYKRNQANFIKMYRDGFINNVLKAYSRYGSIWL
jgi:hypothetical protein